MCRTVRATTPGEQETLAQCPAAVADAAVVEQRGSQAVSGDGRPQLGGQREEMNERRDDYASVDAAQSVSVVGEQQADVVRQRRPGHLNHRLTERVAVQ